MRSRRFAFEGVRSAVLIACLSSALGAQHSVARMWNEATLVGIRNDYARPTVHARNLWHVSMAMYDAWAAYDATATGYLLGRTVGGFSVPFSGVPVPADIASARDEAISFAAYRILKHRFKGSPDEGPSFAFFDSLFIALGYDSSDHAVDYAGGSPAALGNYVAASVISFGHQDGSFEELGYINQFYLPLNPPLFPNDPGNDTLIDPNRWQPLAFEKFEDQSGNVTYGTVPKFLSPEWGEVVPFSLQPADRTTFVRDGYSYQVYHDPGPPPYLDTLTYGGTSDEYTWTFSLVAIWSSQLDATDPVMWDVSPASIGNIGTLPATVAEHHVFYDLFGGGDPSSGYTVNPRTQQPYQPQMVPRGDYARVLAEFWADGPDSETPPGHWFVITNYVSDHPGFTKRYRGQGPVLDDLEWDVKAYFALGGAMHDAAIAAWGIKGRYDYIRPISAIRYMAGKGQSSDTSLASYHPAGIPLVPGYIELVSANDSLALLDSANAGKIKVKAWRGPTAVADPRSDVGGVGWILAENWWPYQRPTFITPPFAGYVSGHSTYSRAAAELLTLLTGDEYFPGGMGEFFCPKNEFLVFEDGPSVDVTLQWAKYRDASDQCSLSRIWGGIHPPADDIPGRRIGEVIGTQAFALAEQFFTGQATSVRSAGTVASAATHYAYPNPVRSGEMLWAGGSVSGESARLTMYNILGQAVRTADIRAGNPSARPALDTRGLAAGMYLLRISTATTETMQRVIILR